MNIPFRKLTAVSTIVVLSGCAATGENIQANVYKAGQVNQTQEAKTVQILAVLPAKIEVDNKFQALQLAVWRTIIQERLLLAEQLLVVL